MEPRWGSILLGRGETEGGSPHWGEESPSHGELHNVGIDLPAVSEVYVLPDDEAEAQEELQKLADATDAPGDALATFFDTEVELPPLGVQDPGQSGQ